MTQAPPVEDWAVSHLLLDPENPRLPADLREREQIELLRYFVVHYDLEELGWSMAEKGYFAEEPLLTTLAENPDYRVVVEGNRRLATLKLLIERVVAVALAAYWGGEALTSAGLGTRARLLPSVRPSLASLEGWESGSRANQRSFGAG